MKTVLYIGMTNQPVEVITKTYMGSNYKVITDYFTLDGKKLMLEAVKDSTAYYPAFNYSSYANNVLPIIKAGTVVSPSVLGNGYSCHDFKLSH